MPKLLYQGHGSFRLTTNDGRIIYVDPFAGEGYDAPADLILVTHQHRDHSKISLCAKKQECKIITNVDALAGGRHNRFVYELGRSLEIYSELYGISKMANRENFH